MQKKKLNARTMPMASYCAIIQRDDLKIGMSDFTKNPKDVTILLGTSIDISSKKN